MTLPAFSPSSLAAWDALDRDKFRDERDAVAENLLLVPLDPPEREAVTAYGSQGVVGGDAGGFAMCFLEFRTRPDAQGQWQVDDILIRSDYEGAGLGRTRNMCEALARQAAGP